MAKHIVERDNRWGFLVKDAFNHFSNFIFKMVYCVESEVGPGFVVDVTRADGVTGRAWFRQKDCRDSHSLTTALNQTFQGGRGGALHCKLSPAQLYDLLDMLTEELFAKENMVRKLLTTVGDQEGGFCIISPDVALNNRGIKIPPASNPFMWIPGWPGCPPQGMARQFAEPPGLNPLSRFIELAHTQLRDNFVPALLSLSCMLMMANYRDILAKLGHFNLPLLFGPPKVGKTLVAQCAGLFSGLSLDESITSRDTLTYLTDAFAKSTLPFVWDDPTSVADVKQVAVDLANGAARGKSGGHQFPQTACLVTANFDIHQMEKYHSRLFVIVFLRPKANPQPGTFAVLTKAAIAASSAFISLKLMASEIEAEEIANVTSGLLSYLEGLDIRVAEGIALPLIICKKMLEVTEKGHLWQQVRAYVKDVLLPYHENTTLNHQPSKAANRMLKELGGLCQHEKKDILRCLEDSVLLDKARAAAALNIAVSEVVAVLKNTPGAEINKSGRIMGKVRKVAKIPMSVLSEDTIRCLTSESDDEVEETRVRETTFPEIQDNESDVEVEETCRVKETTFPEIEDNVDTPDKEQDSFDMGDLPPPPPPLPSLNGSISNDFPPPPFIEMMGNMSVDMGTPIEEGHQADEPLPSPPRLPLESVQRVPMSDLCATCGKKGRRGLLWLCCDGCQQWYHRSCAGISVQAYRTIGGNPWNCRHCH